MDTCAGWRAEKRGSRGKRRKGRRRNGQRIEEGRQRIERRAQRAGRERRGIRDIKGGYPMLRKGGYTLSIRPLREY